MRRECQCEHSARNTHYEDNLGLFDNHDDKTRNVQNAIDLLDQKIDDAGVGVYVTISQYNEDQQELNERLNTFVTDEDVQESIEVNTKYFPKVVDQSGGGIQNPFIKVIYYQSTWDTLIESGTMVTPYFYVNLGLEEPYELNQGSYFPNIISEGDILTNEDITACATGIYDFSGTPNFNIREHRVYDVNKDGEINMNDFYLITEYRDNSEGIGAKYDRSWNGFKTFLRDKGIPCDL